MSNIVSILQNRSASLSNQCAYRFLEDGINEKEYINFGELDQKARILAAFLQEKKLSGHRLLLLYPPGIEFIISFMGCLYAGAIAVPVHCPKVKEFPDLQKLIQVIADDAEISGVLTSESHILVVEECFADSLLKNNIFVKSVTQIVPQVTYKLIEIADDTIAYLQYTSGSTSTPKAAIIRHGNLIHSLKYSAKVWHCTKDSIALTWAPHTHVYGLVCGLLLPIYQGILSIIIPPTTFIRNPICWLRAITKYRVTHSGCPNFGYEVCIRDIDKSDLKGLNLKSWKVAINGGELVQYETLVKFCKKFGAYGFHLNQFNSAYGMSELSGAIAVGQVGKQPKYFELDKDGLKNNDVIIVKENRNSSKFVSSGHLLPGLHAIIVDPETLLPLSGNKVGEIWLTGKSLVSGYWRREDETQAVFHSTLSGSHQTYFRTGDLGFLHDHELCLTGRLKDIIIINGKKYYSLDLETTIAKSMKDLSFANSGVIFSVPIKEKEEVIVIEEIGDESDALIQDKIIQTVKLELMKQYGIDVYGIFLVKPNSIPKTQSGKLQRKLCEQKLLSNQLEVVKKYLKNHSEISHEENTKEKIAFVDIVASVLKIPAHKIDLHVPVSQYGFDSINIIKITELLNETYQLQLTPAILFEYANLADFYNDYFNELKPKNPSITKIEEKQPEKTRIKTQDIAIIGMSGIFPHAQDVETFWNNLIHGDDAISEIPSDRWDWKAIYGNPQVEENKTNIKWGGFLEEVTQFDAGFFNISPHEAELTDPQQRLFLQTVWKTIEDAGYAVTTISQLKTGLFVGVFGHDYADLLEKNRIFEAYTATGTAISILANRVSFLLNLQGPSEVIDTACSSSLVAIHNAVRAIQDGDCEIAIAGGVNLLLTPKSFISANKAGMLSEDGRCKTFDSKANGYVRGEGSAAILLKPLDKALEDHDQIYGIIKGTAVNHGGHAKSLTAPNPNAQAELIVTALRRAQLDIDTIQYVETHGTGTALGDPIEINGLKKAFQVIAAEQGKSLGQKYCGLGSVKTHIGHLESAAGIAGVIKVLLALRHEQIPANLHFDEMNPYIEIKDSPFYIVDKNIPWVKMQDVPRRAGVSSFGFGGTNAHVVLEEWVAKEIIPETNINYPFFVGVSAKTKKALIQRLIDLHDWITHQKQTENLLVALSFTLNVGRDHFEKRCVFVVDSINELQELISKVLHNKGRMPENVVMKKSGHEKSIDRPIYSKLHQQLLRELNNNISKAEYRNNLLALADLYVEGFAIDFEQLIYGQNKQRISLPTYPFAKEYYWIPKNKSTQADNTISVTRLHPLIDFNVSTFEVEQFTKLFTGNEFYLRDHKILDEKVLPAVVYLEMARVASTFALPSHRIKSFQNITWVRPLRIDSQAVLTKISLYSEGSRINFEVTAEDSLLASGMIAYETTNNQKYVDILSLKQKLAIKQTSDALYERFLSFGIQYGSSFRVVQEIQKDDHQVLAKIKIPEELQKEGNQYILHPSLMDGVLQTTLTLLDDNQNLFIPYSIAQIDIFNKLTVICYVYAKRINSEDKDQPQFDLQMLDESGNVLVSIMNFRLHKIREHNESIVYYHSVWEKDNLIENKSVTTPVLQNNEGILIFDDKGQVAHLFRDKLSDQKIFFVTGGESFQIINDNVYWLNKISIDDYNQLFNDIKDHNIIPRYIIFHINNVNSDIVSENEISSQLQNNFVELFYLCRALILSKINKNIQILCVNENPSLFTAALSGFAKTLHLENPHLTCRIITFHHPNDIFHELNKSEINVWYDNNHQRWTKKIAEISSPNELSNTILKEHGVYLITGGMGGLGVIFADYLAQHYKAKLVLLGRSPLKNTQKQIMEKLENDGANVLYLQADISQCDDVARVLQEIKERFGALNGIIHSAGIVSDSFILQKDPNQFSQVFAPKINGTINLDLLTQSEPLDFFVIFSSVASIFGNVGQCDYSYANAFIDFFAEYREDLRRNNKRAGKTIAMNWSYWSEGGMSMNETSRDMTMRSHGLSPISTQQGIKAFVDALNQEYNQIIVLSGDRKKITTSLHDTAEKFVSASEINIEPKEEDISPVKIDQSELKLQLEKFLKELLSSETGLPIEEIDSDESMESFGIDSVMNTQLNLKLSKIFGELSKTLFFEYKTLSALTSYFIENHLSKIQKVLENRLQHTPKIKTSKLLKEAKQRKISKDALKISSDLKRSEKSFDIAIIGMSGKYPLANDLDMFWENLKSGKDCIMEIPRDRWNTDEFFDANKDHLGTSYSKWGGYIDDVDKFDPLFFNISPADAELMDPQERLFLETTWNTIEDAGYSRESLAGHKIGVFVGVMYGSYQLFGIEEAVKGNFVPINSIYSSIPNRVSYFFDFMGPSFAVDTMCSSSMTAIHLAYKSLLDGECELAVAGGVNLSIHPSKYILLSQERFLSSDGHCRSFGESGDGYVPSEGVGAILLKPLNQAIADGDHIYGVIKGSTLNHGGRTNGYTVPNPAAQAALIKEAYQQAHIDPMTVSYIEAHGTGTALGDPIEISGLEKVFHPRDMSYPIGSVKSNIGHCEGAAGIASVTKVLLQLQYKTLVPSILSDKLNKNINWEASKFKVQQNVSEWIRPSIYENNIKKEYPRIAGISSFGAGGSNAHLIISEPPEISKQSFIAKPFYLMTLSAKTEEALNHKISDLYDWLIKHEESILEEISYTLNAGRSHFEKRFAIVVKSKDELLESLKKIKNASKLNNMHINVNKKIEREDNEVYTKVLNKMIEDISQNKLLTEKEYFDHLLFLGKSYVDGYDLDWTKLHSNESKRKISLPTYPFANERYWWSDSVSKNSKNVIYRSLEIVPESKVISSESRLLVEPSSNYENHVKNILLDNISELLKIDKQKIEMDKNLSEYGMDSVHFVNLAKIFDDIYHITITPAKFYAHNSVKAISEFLLNEFPDVFGSSVSVTKAVSVPNFLDSAEKPRDDVKGISAAKNQEPIAIVGMSGIFPQSPDLETFWDNLAACKDLVTEIPIERWDWRQNYGGAKENPSKTNSKWGGFIEEFDKFDAGFFNLSAREANLMDPQQRLFLEVIWKAIEDAGYDPFEFSDRSVGVFAGVEFSEYHTLIAKQHKDFHGLISTGNSHSVIANRISYFFNWHGPSESIDTACSSSLVAIHRAVNAICNGECSLALAGGVSLILDPDTYVITSQLGALSPDGRCKTFDKSANGYVKGEGVAALLLKPLSQALQDKDYIYGVIKGTSVNHGGRAQSLTAPNAIAQSELLIKAYLQANVNPATVTYIEAHGTGTELGDPVEVEGLKRAFNMLNPESNFIDYCGLGSVKTNIGHLEPASGIAGVIKVLLAMLHAKIPGSIHFKELNPYIEISKSPFYIIDKTQSWLRIKDQSGADIPRRAGVSSFGFGGTNAHIVLEEFPLKPEFKDPQLKPYYLITLSAKQDASLNRKIADLYEWLKHNFSKINLESLSFTLNAGRTHFPIRCALIVNSLEELLNSLQELMDNKIPNNFIKNTSSETNLTGPVVDEIYKTTMTALSFYDDENSQNYRDKLFLLADLYVKHYHINWYKLHKNESNRRLHSLPSYPFIKQRYWFDYEIPKKVPTPEPLSTRKPEALPIAQSKMDEPNILLTDYTLEYLRHIFADVLQIPLYQINFNETYERYGVDSVLGMEITNRLDKDFGNISKTILYEYTKLNDLANFLEKNYAEKLNALFHIPSSEVEPTVVDSKPIFSEENLRSLDIAIVGLSGTFPKAKDMDEFWENLVSGKDCITEIPKERWNYKDYPVTVGGKEKYFQYGGFIPDVDKFDPLFFNISPHDAALMDPQERIFLQSVWTTLEDAGYTRDSLQKTTNNEVGVFVGVTYNYYPVCMEDEWNKGNRVPIDSQMFSVANRVSYFLNLNGPSFIVDTACSSSLAAIHLACDSIIKGECKAAIAGGVNLSLHPSKFHFLGTFNFMSDDGHCNTFAEGGTGYVPSEGVGSVLLKPLSLAIKDKDRIYGVIKSSSMNHGGKTSGYTVPNPKAQANLIKDAIIKAHIDPRSISYMEAHGTGTSLGDPIEVRGLQEAFEQFTQDKQFCAIGSVKSNIGHLESAAGISQLAKVLLQMEYKKLVPSIHSEKLNPFINFQNTPFYVQREVSDWVPPMGLPRLAGISSFGAGGTNVHLIVEEYINKTDLTSSFPEPDENTPFVFLLSALNQERLQEYITIVHSFLTKEIKQHDKQWLANVCYTSQIGRESMPSRCAIMASSGEDLLTKLASMMDHPNLKMNEIWLNENAKSQSKEVYNLEKLIHQKNYVKLIENWIQGFKIPWEKLYDQENVRKVHIPTYPFMKRRCWFAKKELQSTQNVVNVIDSSKPVNNVIYSDEVNLKDWLYTTRWEKNPLKKTSQALDRKDEFWLIISDTFLGSHLQNKQNCIYCLSGKSFRKIDKTIYYINSENSDDYKQLISEINSQYQNQLKGVIYFANISGDITDPDKIDLTILSQKAEHSDKLLYLFQALVLNKWQNKLLFCLITRGSQVIYPSEPIQMWQHHLWSMTRIFMLEQPEYHSLLIDLDISIDLAAEAECIVNEIRNYHSEENHIAYRNGSRHTIRLVNDLPEIDEIKNSSFQTPEAAIITGGLGALGGEVAKLLISQGTKYLLLIGSTKLPDRSGWKNISDVALKEKISTLIELEKSGTNVRYISANITQKGEIQQAVKDVEKLWQKSINGVFHLAGVTTDTISIAKMDKMTLDNVLSVKMQGALVLHEIFKKANLNCFVIFSSIAAIPYFGLSGLSAYSMASEFLNGFAEFRRSKGLPALCLNWVAWKEKGMSHKYKHHEFLEAVGMSALSLKQGIQLLKQLLPINAENITVCHIDWQKFFKSNPEARKLDFFKNFISQDKKAEIPSITKAPLNEMQVTDLIAKTLARFLELDVNEIDPKIPFQTYGMDSIIGINFIAELNQYFPDVISAMDLYRYPTLKQLTEFVLQNINIPSTDSSVIEDEHTDKDDDDELYAEISHLNNEQVTDRLEKEIKEIDKKYG